MRKWTTEDSAELYNINGWGIKYFGINEKGNIFADPKVNGIQVDLADLINELTIRDVSTPILLRFPDIIDNRIQTINDCFVRASEEYDYKGDYYTVYPIKVNQTKQVVEEIIDFGEKYNVGLEAGSKPELHVVLAYTEKSNSLIVCNGYKDEAFIELALLAKKMGRKVIIVVEKLNELKLIIKISKRLNVQPDIGIRIKLASSGSGKWEDSGGDKSKFGLSASELLDAVSIAKKEGQLENIKLIHFHIGSQVTKIRKIKTALREASHFFVQMKREGCNIEFVDVGGGLGIDYDGSKSNNASSINYSIQEYANDIIANITDACEKNNIEHPAIITESGRSLTAHHSVLVIDVLESTVIPMWDDDLPHDIDNELFLELKEIYETLNQSRMLESWHDAQQIREEALDRFSLGMIDLKTRAYVERLFWSITKEIYSISNEMRHSSEELRIIPKMLADKYFCNFSIFQSIPDSWAIDQLFPIVPIHRLNEKPNRVATLHDITCDSDGKIEHFIGSRDLSHYLPVHTLKKNERYYLGIFLVGAYQEILGDLHNLFGDTNAVHIQINNNGYEIKQIIDGETVSDVLGYVQYNSKRLVRKMEQWVSSSVKSEKISAKEGKEFLANYRSGLYGYTYLEE